MQACATRDTVTETNPICNLILPVPDTDFREFLDEVDELSRFAPEIIEAIEADLNAHAREKKRIRLEDRRFFEGHTSDLPGLDFEEGELLLAEELQLAVGRPRISGYAAYVFLMVRGFLGSLTAKQSRRFLQESMSLYGFLQSRGLSMPAVTTILENVNVISHATRELIFDKQIALIFRDELDDFLTLTIDSTSVKANSSWPNDAKIVTGLLMRAHRLGQKLHMFGMKDFRKGWVPHWLKEMDKLEFHISLVAGKANSKGKVKKYYRRLLRRGQKVIDALTEELSRLKQDLSIETLAPSRRPLLQRLVTQITNDIADAR